MKLNLPQLSALAALSFAPVAHAGLFDKEDSAEPCISTFALKHAFVYDIHTCETALIVETVTQLKKDAEPACLHDTGTELKLLTEKDTKEEAKVALTATCESVKR
eukprot:138854_1